MGLSKEFVQQAFKNSKDRVTVSIIVKPEDLIELADEDIRFLGEAIFCFLPKSEFVESEKDKIRKKFDLPNTMPKINGLEFKTFLKMNSWRKIQSSKLSATEIVKILKTKNT